MILSELRDYLKQQRVSLADLVNHFHADALRSMLKKWIAKSSVRMAG